MEYCKCQDKQILVKGDGMWRAEESNCPTHGYYSSCYLCDSEAYTTETCVAHIEKIVRK